MGPNLTIKPNTADSIAAFKPVKFGSVTKKEVVNTTTFNPQGAKTDEVKDMHQISLKAAGQNYASQGFPAALGRFTMQDKALMPPAPALTAVIGHKIQNTFNKKEAPQTSFRRGAEANQAA